VNVHESHTLCGHILGTELHASCAIFENRAKNMETHKVREFLPASELY
jgi:hypothetical protein